MTGVSVATLRHWRHQKRGPKSTRLGKHIVYREADVEAWIEAKFAGADAVGEESA